VPVDPLANASARLMTPLELRCATKRRGCCTVSKIEIAAGSVVTSFAALDRVPRPTRHSLQVGEEQHALLAPRCLRYINHSCDPNSFLDVKGHQLVTLCPVAPGAELTVFYPATDWEMHAPFTCRCGSDRCLGWISGAAALAIGTLDGYVLNEHIRRLAERASRDSRSVGGT
jgi:hypothetical protein